MWERKGDRPEQMPAGSGHHFFLAKGPGTERFSSIQRTDSIEQKCHGLKPRGVGGSKKRTQEFSRLSPRGLLYPSVGSGSGTSRGQWNKGRALFFGAQAFCSSKDPVSSGPLLPPPCLDGILSSWQPDVMHLASGPQGQHCGCTWALRWLGETF